MAAGTVDGLEQAPATAVKDAVEIGSPGTGGIAESMLENGVLPVGESKKATEAERRRRRRKQKKKGKGPSTVNGGGDTDIQSEAEDTPKAVCINPSRRSTHFRCHRNILLSLLGHCPYTT